MTYYDICIYIYIYYYDLKNRCKIMLIIIIIISSTTNPPPIALLTLSPTSPPSSHHTHFIIYLLLTILLFVLVLPLIHGRRPSPKAKLGTLYNCDETTYVGLYGFPPPLHCSDKFLKNAILNFTSKVSQYRETVVPFIHFYVQRRKVHAKMYSKCFGRYFQLHHICCHSRRQQNHKVHRPWTA